MDTDRSFRAIQHLAARELQQRLRSSHTAKQFGFVLAESEPGRVVLRMRVEQRHKQVHGVVHGGVLAALADTAGGLATYMACRRGTRVATVEMKINYLEAVADGSVVAEARVIRRGRHLAVVDCDIGDDQGRLVGKALMTFFVGPFSENRKKASPLSRWRRA
jgi:1,4-dihydroxy-2-naphthoyl-CoA hydrolase